MSDRPVDLNLEELRELIRLLRESNVSEFELQKADYRVRIKHGTVVETSQEGMTPVVAKQSKPSNGQDASTMQTETPSATETPQAPEVPSHEVKSPMVGTFYRSASPGAAAFVEVGDVVHKGQVLCIIEAMKIMNEIESDVDGEVLKIHISNGQPVEFSEILFTVKSA
jgi:acetyl-CoA carboxylase biotin carboxyl carrier protein